ncbi:MAG: hypothetical protein ACYC6C_11200, partial [Coriobacteriia bacterium]
MNKKIFSTILIIFCFLNINAQQKDATIIAVNENLKILNPTNKSKDSVKEFLIGVDDGGDISVRNKTVPYDLIAPMKELGVQFLVHHYNPQFTLHEQIQFIDSMGMLFDRNNIRFLLNTESCNGSLSFMDSTDWDWCRGSNNTHHFNFKPAVLMEANQYKSFDGVVYDEPAHMQINQNWIWVNGKKLNMPFFAETTGKSFEQADQLIYKNASQLVEGYKRLNTRYVAAEQVFPVLFCNFARAGMTPVYKQLKESWAPIWTACAMGAAIEYHTELWACLDLWFIGDYPGHSPEELKNNLIYAYWMGNDRVYVENLNYKGSLYHSVQSGDKIKIILNNYGKVYKWFTHKYLSQNKRGYTFRDFKPKIAIIRFDDTDFGLGGKNGWPDQLFGSYTLKSSDITRNWLKIWNLISHGVIPKDGISWDSYPIGTPYRSFAPLNGVI